MQECDLIMKGGITSGVVYPHALAEVAQDYRLRKIGGTSAGAIAAVFAAAAEYRRQKSGTNDMSGFDMVADLGDELGETMQSLFQPAKPLKPIFDILIALVSETARTKGKTGPLLSAVLTAFKGRLALAAAALVAWLAIAVVQMNLFLFLFGCLLTGVIVLASLAMSVRTMVLTDLPKHGFGLCPGIRQPGYDGPGFTDWIADKIDLLAGNVAPDGTLGEPLTVGDLEAFGIEVATMTTDLSSKRPYQLPFRTKIHYFSDADLAPLLPARVLAFLRHKGKPVAVDDPDAPKDLIQMPVGKDFPLLLVARMSLSFPGLISAIGLYRHDNEAAKLPNGAYPVRRCLFSDGGISSNFPIHFFDALAPQRPTFGIALAAWEEGRDGNDRIDLPTAGRVATALPISPINGLGSFLAAILNTAKDWQDTLQSLLPGYSERIVTVKLDEKREGGLNLAMDADTIRALTEYGRLAGSALCNSYSYGRATVSGKYVTTAFDQHRYNRAISLLPEMEDALAAYAIAMAARPAGAPSNSLTGSEVLTVFKTNHFKNSATWRSGVLAPFADSIVQIGRTAVAAQAAIPAGGVRSGKIPSVDSTIRLAATPDRVPR